MDKIKAPEKLDFDASDIAHTWKKWKEEFMLYLDLAMADKEDQQKVKMFRYLIGSRGREIYETMVFDDENEGGEERRTIKTVLDKFDAYCNPLKNESVERYKFNSRMQQSNETVYNYVTELKLLAAHCGFGDIEESLIRDRIVCGIRDTHLRERLLRETQLTLKNCLEICRASELSKERIKQINIPAEAAAAEVHAVKNFRPSFKGKCDPKKDSTAKAKSAAMCDCIYCGRKHERTREKCPAYGQICRKCHKMDHFATMCKQHTQQRNHKNSKHKVHRGQRVHYVYTDSEDESADYFETIKTVSVHPKKHVYATMCIQSEKRIKFQIDSGASCNVIPVSKLSGVKYSLEKANKVLTTYSNSVIEPIGKTSLKVKNPRNLEEYWVDFIVVKQETTPILGSETIQRMKLVTINYDNIASLDRREATLTEDVVFSEYKDIFEGTGCLPGTYHIETDPLVQPVVHPPRKIPIALRDKLKTELGRLTELEIIAPVTEPTPWVNNLVVVEKPNKLRICLDPRDLNRAIQRSHYPMPTIEQLLPDLKKAKVFTVADAKNGFWHVPLDTESSMLTTFNTPHGRFRWLRMPFGLNSAPEEFQRRQNQAVEGLNGVKCVHDDILIIGEGDNYEEACRDHDRNFQALMERCREKNLKLNKDKLNFRRKEVKFVGHVLTGEGVRADPDKIKAVLEMPTPTDVSAVRRFVGFITYLSKFLPKLSDLCEPLRKLTMQDVEWCWLESHDHTISEIKKLVCSGPVLRYYDPSEELTVQCDASLTGLGASLLQNGQPVAFASRALTDAETRYAQIEKEMLAVVFGLERFHQYTYGRHVNVESDHKPLESIVKKSLLSAPRRLQRMLLRLQQYEYTISYKPGSAMYIADTLSRAYLGNVDSTSFEKDVEIINMVSYLPISESRIRDIQSETLRDEGLQKLKETVLNGWAAKRENAPALVKPYFDIRDELSTQDGILFRGERVVIPKVLRADMIKRIHSSHIGIGGCLRRAKDYVYWPGMHNEILQYIQNCETCQMMENKQQKETLVSHDVPDRPWAKVGTDLCSFNGNAYLVTVDYFSSFWEIDYLENTKPETVIRKLRTLFARYGIPDIVVSDNGPHFSCKEFAKFATEWDFKHVTSSPTYPQSNGKVENAVKTAKRLMKRAHNSHQDVYLSLLDFRNTPTQGMTSSPAQRLMCRRTRTLLPTKRSLLELRIPKNVSREIKHSQDKQARYYNKSAKDLSELKKNDRVWISPKQGDRTKTWSKATVRRKVNIRSYEVLTDDGQVLRRNRRDIRVNRKTAQNDLQTQSDNPEYVTDEYTDNAYTPIDNIPVCRSRVPNATERNVSESRTRNTSNETRTKSGRLVKPPQRFQD